MDNVVIVEIVILAMIAAFLGLRLYSVLGRRAEHEEEPVPTRFEKSGNASGAARAPQPMQPSPAPLRPRELAGASPATEAFWRGDRDELKALCSPEVYASFASAIDAREQAGEQLDNRLVRIEEATIYAAELDRRAARIAVQFTADIAAVTRDRDGDVIAGSLDDAIESRDIWTFSRDVGAAGPDWVLEETDVA